MRRLICGILLITLFLIASQIDIPSGISLSSASNSQIAPTFPTLPRRLTWHSFGYYIENFLHWIVASEKHELQKYVGEFTSNRDYLLTIRPVYASSSIVVDASCSATALSQPNVACLLDHSANVLILIFATVNNTSHSGTVSSVTVNGFSAALMTSLGNSTSLILYVYWLYAPYSANDSIVVNYSGASNNAEAIVAASFIGTRNTLPLFNSRVSGSGSAGTSALERPPAGEVSRRIIEAIAINSNSTITNGSSQTQITQVNATGASVELNYRDTGSSVTMTGSWSGRTDNGSIAFALLPPNQVVTDSVTDGRNAIVTGSIRDGTTGNLNSPAQNSGDVIIVAVGILNNSSQTVSNVACTCGTTTNGGINNNMFRLHTTANSNNISTDIWYFYQPLFATTVTVTLSAPANAVIVMTAFANARQVQLFEDAAAATGISSTASVTVYSGTANRRILLATSFATSATPIGSQGVDVAGTNANSVGVDLNYLDTSSQETMRATASSSNWAAIGAGLLPFGPIQVDATCSSTGSSASSISCSLNHTANVLIVIWVAIYDANNSGNGSVGTVTVAGNAPTAVTTSQCSTFSTVNASCLSLYYYFSTSASNDQITVTYNNASNNPEAILATSFTGTRTTPPFFNAQNYGHACQPTSCGGVIQADGSLNRVVIMATEIGHNDVFVPEQIKQQVNYDVVQTSGNSNAMDLVASNLGKVSVNPVTSWTSSSNSNGVEVAIVLLPPNQIVVDGDTSGGLTGGGNVDCIVTSTGANSGSCALQSHDPNVLVIIAVAIINRMSQTVQNVGIGSSSFTRLQTTTNGTNISTDVWYLWDTNSGAETISINLSGTAAFAAIATALANTANTQSCVPSSNCFEQTASNVGKSGTASVAVSSGTDNRMVVLVSSFVRSQPCVVGSGGNIACIVGNQGADLTDFEGNPPANASVATDFNIFLQPSSYPYVMQAADTPANWAAIGTAILPCCS